MKWVFALLTLLALATSDNAQTLPGSGNSLQFNGTTQYVSIPDDDLRNDFSTSQDFTVECWVRPASTQANTAATSNAIVEKWSLAGGYSYVIRYQNQTSGLGPGKVNIARYDGSNNPSILSTATVNDNKWHHIALTRSGGASGVLNLYIDGIQQGSGTADNTTGATQNNSALYLGCRGNNTLYFTGEMDEVRIWNTGLTQTQLRDRMCLKITASDALYSNLTAYYNFDETSGATLTDSRNSVNGTLINGPSRQASGAAIGNTSTYSYTGSSVSLTQPTRGDQLTVSLASGSTSGVHVYNVAAKPNSLTGTTGVGNNNSYFGVFAVAGSSAQFSTVYNYAGLNGINDENDLRLFSRSDNAAATWSTTGATINTGANTLTTTSPAAEFIVGSAGVPLPLSLLSFTGRRSGSTVQLQWETADEQGLSRFEVERSIDGMQFDRIGAVTPGTGRSSGYRFTDTHPYASGKSYYRLKIAEEGGDDFSYSTIVAIDVTSRLALSITPMPVQEMLHISNIPAPGTVNILSIDGSVLLRSEVSGADGEVSLRVLQRGIYILRYECAVGASNYRIIKQ